VLIRLLVPTRGVIKYLESHSKSDTGGELTENTIQEGTLLTKKVESYLRDDIMFNSSHLLDIFDTTHLQKPHEPSMPLSLDTVATSRLKEWTTAPEIHLLSIAGRKPKSLELAPMTLLASMCVDFAINSRLPVVSYFCELPQSEDLRPGNTRESQALISLTYALIRQFIELVPAEFETNFDFSQERLSLLDGTMQSWNEAIGLLRNLIQLIPKPLFCIVDGFQLLDDPSTDQYLDGIIGALSGSALADTNRLKVLITTTSRSRSLIRNLSTQDLVFADRDGAVDSPSRRGGNKRVIL
jgi:hypothetical protein